MVMTTLPVPGVLGGKAAMITSARGVRWQSGEVPVLVDCWATTGNKLHTGALLVPLSLSH